MKSVYAATDDRRLTGPALRVAQITKRFGGVTVFEGISFELSPGGILGIIGPNGAGKTTLINVISGMLSPTSGAISLGNESIVGKPFHGVSRLGIVRSFQQTNTFRSASVEENLFRAQRFSAARGDKNLDLAGLFEEFRLARHMHDPSDKLPYGVQKMLGLLMALAAHPRFLLLDEPAAGLERKERTLVDHFVRHAQERLGCGVLIVEHDMDLVRRLCPEIVVLEAGRILASGPPDQVLARQEVIDAYLGVSEGAEC